MIVSFAQGSFATNFIGQQTTDEVSDLNGSSTMVESGVDDSPNLVSSFLASHRFQKANSNE